MKKLLVNAAVLAALSGSALSAHALLLDFNDLPGLPAYFTTPYVKDGVAFTFGTNLVATQDWIYSNIQDPFNLPVSGGWVGTSCNLDGTDDLGFKPCGVSETRDSQRVNADATFRMNSVWLSGSDPFLEPLTLIFNLYEDIGDAAPVAQESFLLADVTGATQQFFFTYGGYVREFSINGVHGYFAMDNIDVTVPEPGTTALVVLAGLLAVGVSSRKRSV